MTIELHETTVTRNTAIVTQFVATFSVPTAGDFLKVQFVTNSNTVLAAPSGWTLRYSNTLYPAKFYVYYKVCDGSEGTSATWTLTTPGQRNAGQCQRFTGVNATTPWDVANSVLTSNASAGTIVIPSVVAVSAGAMLVSGAAADITAAALTHPGGWTETDNSGNTGTKMQSAAQLFTATPGATGTITWTISTAATGRTGWACALRPAFPTIATAGALGSATPVESTIGADGPVTVRAPRVSS